MAEDITRIAKTPTMGEIAGRATDPRFYAALSILPDPDPILRRAGKNTEVYSAIQSDSHVIGELRAIKADFMRFEHRLEAGGDRRAERRALELCQSVLARDPAPYTRWPDVYWNIASSTFRGLSVHEIVWDKFGEWILPREVSDRPKRRFVFKGNGELRVITKSDPMYGIPAEQLYFLVDRHMPSYDQPYGVALLSSCFWPYTFKHAGFRWFIKFCERVGIPFPKGHYPVGADTDTKDALADALENLLEAGYAALEEGSDIDLMESQSLGTGSNLVHNQLIQTCNAEMSKALASQTLATELPDGAGSRAATETHAGRAGGINEGDRERIANTLDQLWRLITEINFGPNVAPPTSHFASDAAATLDRAKIYQTFTDQGGQPSRKAMARDLDIELADPTDPEDSMQSAPAPAPAPGETNPGAASFAAFRASEPETVSDKQSAQLDKNLMPVMEDWIGKIRDLVESADSLEAIRDGLLDLYPDLKTDEYARLMGEALSAAALAGRYDVMEEASGRG